MSREFELRESVVPDPRIRQHHTIYRGVLKATYGGLHDTRKGAIQARQARANASRRSDYTPTAAQEHSAKGWEQAPVIELEVGQEYQPFGSKGIRFKHGIDDGTHGSVLKDKSVQHILTPELEF